ncbi:MAG: hypothetical protein WC480_03805 [Patescibacteria group bacterium]
MSNINSKKTTAKLKVAVLCGGPSAERGISLNSSRSLMDHLQSAQIEIIPIYFDTQKNPYQISKAQLYSNTPSDFDFKLKQTAQPLTAKGLVSLLKKIDITFPAMHGQFGEDGQIQSFLAKHHLPFVGSSAPTCRQAFDKFIANEFIKQQGFFTLPSAVLRINHSDHRQIVKKFFKNYQIKRAIVKPAIGGSSIGVFSVATPNQALAKAKLLFSQRTTNRVVIEPFAKGTEFTMIILENHLGLPVALPPTEIETDYTEHQIFDFRKKYLPTHQVTWHCPPRFNDKIIEKIQAQGEQLFSLFKMRDFGRFDGWVLPNGQIWFCDFNMISGMEQNSFLFQQASRIGLTHSDVLQYIIKRTCNRYNIPFPVAQKTITTRRQPVSVLMGGADSERQVSLMSGTNVWLKLRRSTKYQPKPYLLDPQGLIWRLPYHLCLNHTVEEITQNCRHYQAAAKRLTSFEERARLHLGLTEIKDKKDFFAPEKLNFNQLIKESDFIFIALHGGDGENGNLQKILTKRGVRFNGPEEQASRLCMDKRATANFINQLKIPGVKSVPGKIIKTKTAIKFNQKQIEQLWTKAQKELTAKTLIIKPRGDGCSTGIAHLYSANDLAKYLKIIATGDGCIPKQTFQNQLSIIEMPPSPPTELLLEQFVYTDILRAHNNQLKHGHRTGWVEITVGVVEDHNTLKAFNPSITVVEGEVLTVEEKFQGGTGINITPPPKDIIKPAVLSKIKKSIQLVAKKIGLRGYARIDAFVNIQTGDLLIIEVNTLPGLTPSTVLYQQALAETPPIFPRELLEKLIQNKKY